MKNCSSIFFNTYKLMLKCKHVYLNLMDGTVTEYVRISRNFMLFFKMLVFFLSLDNKIYKCNVYFNALLCTSYCNSMH